MKPTVLLDQAVTPDGRPMTLHEHDGVFMIRIAGVELMSSRQHHSEERLAELACSHVRSAAAARVLIGGLGLGFTLRTALRNLDADARVVVAELMPAVIRWNREIRYGLGADAIADPRTEIVTGDVADVLRTNRGGFDAIILDVDNGAQGLTIASNDRLYQAGGLGLLRRSLRPAGCLAVWSVDDDPAFVDRMRDCGFAVTVERARVHPRGGGWNHLFLGRIGGRSR